MSHANTSAQQLVSANTAYSIDAAVEEYNEQSSKLRSDFSRDFDRWVNGGTKMGSRKENSRFDFLRADWSHQRKRPLFNFTYFRTRHFRDQMRGYGPSEHTADLSEVVAAALMGNRSFFGVAEDANGHKKKKVRERLGCLSKDFTDYRLFLETYPGLSRALRLAAGALKDPGKLRNDLLHHYLLSLYTRMPVEGGIPSLLGSVFRGQFPSAALIHTVPPAQMLPSIKILSCWFSKDGLDLKEEEGSYAQRAFSVEYDDEKAPKIADLYQFLNALFWKSEIAFGQLGVAPLGGTSLHKEGDELLNQNLLFLPVYAQYPLETLEPAGPFLGWLFQFLPRHKKDAAEKTLSSLLSDGDPAAQSRCGVLRDYLTECQRRLPLLASRLGRIASDEILIQDTSIGGAKNRENETVEFLAQELQNSQPWQQVTKEVWSEVDGEEYWKPLEDEKTRQVKALRIRLDPSPLDDPARWGLEIGRRDTVSGLILVAENGNVILPIKTANPFYMHYAREVRDLYRQLRLRAAREEAAGLRLQNDLAHTFTHTFVKLGHAISFSLKQTDAIAYLDYLLAELKDEKQVENLGYCVGQLRNPPASDLYDYYFESLNTFNSSVQLLERKVTVSPGKRVGMTLKAFLEKTYDRAAKIARHLVRGGVNETIPRAEKRCDRLGKSGVLELSKSLADVSLREVATNASSEEFAAVAASLLEFAFVEVFINCLTALGTAVRLKCNHPPTVSVAFEEAVGSDSLFSTLVVQNIIMRPPDAGLDLTAKSDLELELRRPAQEKGTSGWGWYGTNRLLDDILGIGRIRRSCRLLDCKPEPHVTGTVRILLRKEWLIP